jgi:hypothetical protein
MLTFNQYVVWALSTLVSAFVGSYLAGYLKKKGENLATHEDISKLVDQVEAVTEATKKIEAEISVGVWNKQKRWEMKREVLFEAAKRMSEVDDAIVGWMLVMKEHQAKQKALATSVPSPEEQLAWEQVKNDVAKRWISGIAAFHETTLFVGIVCREDAKKAFEDLSRFVDALGGQITEVPDAYRAAKPELDRRIQVARDAIRKELEVDV